MIKINLVNFWIYLKSFSQSNIGQLEYLLKILIYYAQPDLKLPFT